MKRYLSILLAAVMIFTIGCGKDTTKDNENKDTKANPTVTVTAAPTQSAEPSSTPEPTEAPSATATVSVIPAPTESADATQEAVTSNPTLVPSVDNTKAPSAEPTETAEATATVKPTAKPTVKPTSKPTVKPTFKPTAQPTIAPTASVAAGTPPYTYTKEEHRQIAAELVKEINKLRNVQLIVLPGLTEYAEYRAKQLETNFAHDGNDIRTAANTLKYGQFVDPRKWGDVGEPFYQSISAEAIYYGSSDAFTVADSLHRSTGHWSYVGSDEYLYVGVGVSESINRWGGRGAMVVCVCVAKTNSDILSEFNREAEKKDCEIMYYVNPDGTYCVWNESTQDYSKVYSSLEQWYDDWKKGNMFGLQK